MAQTTEWLHAIIELYEEVKSSISTVPPTLFYGTIFKVQLSTILFTTKFHVKWFHSLMQPTKPTFMSKIFLALLSVCIKCGLILINKILVYIMLLTYQILWLFLSAWWHHARRTCKSKRSNNHKARNICRHSV